MSDAHPYAQDVRERSPGCELCAGDDELRTVDVSAAPEPGAAACVLLCGPCAAGLEGRDPLEDKRWFCLQESAWSETPAVQVVAWRLLQASTQPWAVDLFGQLWLPEEVLAWAQAGVAEEEDAGEVGFLDVNKVPLEAGDTITVIKDLVVKGGGFTAKRGTTVKGIRLTNDPTHIEGNVNGVTIWIKTEFCKKS